MASSLIRTLRAGVLLATFWGLLEGLGWWLFGSAEFVGGARFLSTAILLYAVEAMVLALPIGLAVGAYRHWRHLGEAEVGYYATLWLSLGPVLGLGLWVNRTWLGGSLDGTSLAVDAGLLVLGWPLSFFLLRSPLTSLCGSDRSTARRLAMSWSVLASFGVVAALLGPDPRRGELPPRRTPAAGSPNVLLLLVDTLRADHLGCYGYGKPTSPNLDALAARGLLFENCLASAPHTKPSTASILTGLQPPTHRVELFTSSLASGAFTLHEAFHQGGWRTSLLSANTFLSPTYGFGRGVEYFEGSIVNPVFQLAGAHVFHRLRRIFVHEWHSWRLPWDAVRGLVNWTFLPGGNPYQHGMSGTAIHQEFVSWLDEIGEERPWMAHLHFMEPHAPYDPPAEHRLFQNPAFGSELGVHYPERQETMFLPFVPGLEAAPGEREALLANYDGCIHEVDAQIGLLLADLEARGVLENTLVVLTSDHGEEFFEHGAWGHGHSLHRELLQVPMILAWPGHLPEGARIPEQVRSVDLMPTLLVLAGLDLPDGMEGRALPLHEGTGSRPAFAEVEWGGHGARALRNAEGTLIHAEFQGQTASLLFAASDRLELEALQDQEPQLAHSLGNQLKAERERLSAHALRAQRAAIDEETLLELNALGYVEEEEPEQEP